MSFKFLKKYDKLQQIANNSLKSYIIKIIYISPTTKYTFETKKVSETKNIVKITTENKN